MNQASEASVQENSLVVAQAFVFTTAELARYSRNTCWYKHNVKHKRGCPAQVYSRVRSLLQASSVASVA